MESTLLLAEGVTYKVAGNTPFLITGTDDIWHISAGNIDVFAVETSSGEPIGRRYHLLRMGLGTTIFGVHATSIKGCLGLLAVGGHGTTVTRIPLSRFIELAGHEFQKELIEQAGFWIKSLSNSMTDFLSSGTENHSMHVDEAYLSGDWSVKIENDRIMIAPYGEGAPITLENFHSIVLDNVTERIDGEKIRERERFQQKERIERRAIKSALSTLSGVMHGKKREAPSSSVSEDPLLETLRILAAAMKIDIKLAPDHREQKANTVNDISGRSRIRFRRIALRGRWWREDNGPILAFKGEDESPVAILPDTFLRYTIFDPKDNSKTAINEKTAATISPFGYVFYHPFPVRALQALDLLRLGLKNCVKSDITMIFLMGLAVGLLGIITPIATGRVFDTVIPGAHKTQLVQLAVILLLVAFSSSLFQLVRSLAIFRVETRMDISVQAGLWDRLLNLPVPFFHRFLAGDLAMRSLGVEEIRQVLTSAAISSILSALFTIFNLLLLFYYEWRLALVAIGLIFLAIIVIAVTGFLKLKRQRVVQQIEGRVSGLVLQLLTGISKLRVAAAEERAFAAWAKDFSEQKQQDYKARNISNILSVFNAAFPVITSAVMFGVAGWVITQGAKNSSGFSVGDFLAFSASFGQFLVAGMGMGSTLMSVLEIIPIYERAKPIMDAIPEVSQSKADPGELRGDILISHVYFRYQTNGPLILDNISIAVHPGEFVAFVGPSGAGKSTILRLLLGFDTPESGSIYFDGQDYSTIDVQSVRQQMGVVVQGGQVMPGDIFHNIIGSSSLTLDNAWEAARMAGFDKDIERMPMGMFTFVPEGGSTLSGGQRQRLLIARAVVNRPKILLLDEATSALDNETQAQVSEGLERLKVTRIVIAHRLSTIINAHRIYLLDKGRIVQTGSYSELVNNAGLFADLVKRQMV